MWTSTHSIETSAGPERIWALWRDVTGWPSWNAGVAAAELHGPFASGSRFTMRSPDGDTIESTIDDADPNRGFIDKTHVGEVTVVVDHSYARLASGRLRVTYATTVAGPDAAAIGEMVTDDFDDVLAALKARAEGTAA